jgi:hypothetical protein
MEHHDHEARASTDLLARSYRGFGIGPAGHLRLIAELVGRLSGGIGSQPRRSLLELQGLGRSVWEGVDVDEYLRRERSSWNG